MDEPKYLQVHNWGAFQNADVLKKSAGLPPWIKNYVRQHWDEDYLALTDSQRGHLHDIRLLAARLGNKIPNDPAWVRAAIRSRRAPDLHALSKAGFLEPYDESTANATKTPANQPQSSRHTLEPALETFATDSRLEVDKRREDLDLDLSSSTTQDRPTTPVVNGATRRAETLIRNIGHELTAFSLDDELSRLNVPHADRPRLREMGEQARTVAATHVQPTNAPDLEED